MRRLNRGVGTGSCRCRRGSSTVSVSTGRLVQVRRPGTTTTVVTFTNSDRGGWCYHFLYGCGSDNTITTTSTTTHTRTKSVVRSGQRYNTRRIQEELTPTTTATTTTSTDVW